MLRLVLVTQVGPAAAAAGLAEAGNSGSSAYDPNAAVGAIVYQYRDDSTRIIEGALAAAFVDNAIHYLEETPQMIIERFTDIHQIELSDLASWLAKRGLVYQPGYLAHIVMSNPALILEGSTVRLATPNSRRGGSRTLAVAALVVAGFGLPALLSDSSAARAATFISGRGTAAHSGTLVDVLAGWPSMIALTACVITVLISAVRMLRAGQRPRGPPTRCQDRGCCSSAPSALAAVVHWSRRLARIRVGRYGRHRWGRLETVLRR
jgi:hypothetical protein